MDETVEITEKKGVFKFKCPKCSTEIMSLSRKQVEYNATAHLGSHTTKEAKK
jgi:predicted RNA-binding Zn-ribbon protein involved in translation (DUF1610 family)